MKQENGEEVEQDRKHMDPSLKPATTLACLYSASRIRADFEQGPLQDCTRDVMRWRLPRPR